MKIQVYVLKDCIFYALDLYFRLLHTIQIKNAKQITKLRSICISTRLKIGHQKPIAWLPQPNSPV